MDDLVLADTDVLIDFLTGSQPTADQVESLIRDDRLAVSAVTVFELYAGVQGSRRLRDIGLLLKSAVVVPLETESAVKAGTLYTGLKSRGKLIGNEDILIAAIALHHSMPLLTRNLKHFRQIDGLSLFTPPTP